MNDRIRGHGRAARDLVAVALICAIALASVAVAVTPQMATAARPKDRGRITPQVVGGDPVDDGKYPFVVALLDVSYGRNAFERQYCGGSLIDVSHVVTAAHCVSHPKPRRSNLRVIVGRTKLRSGDGEGRGVRRIRVHPDYNPRISNAFDVAVLTLDKAVPTTFAPIQPVASGDYDFEDHGDTTIVAGWGSMTAVFADGGGGRAQFPDRMREAEVERRLRRRLRRSV